MVSTHDAGAIFGLDASGGLPAVVAAMLLSSTRDRLTILPALPAAWPSGAVTGLVARGGLVVDRLCWSDQGAELTVHAVPGTAWLRRGTTTVRLPRAGRLVTGTSGARWRAENELELLVGDRPVSLNLQWCDR